MSFGGFGKTRKPSILITEEGSGVTKRLTTLIVSDGTLTDDGGGSLSLDTGGGSANISGSDGQIAIFSGSSTIVGFDDLKYDQTTVTLSGNLEAQDATVTNLFTGDLHMKNERGNWTLHEERDSLVVRNNITGEKFKIVLEKIEKK